MLLTNSPALEEILDRSPATVSPETPLIEALTQMHRLAGSHCDLSTVTSSETLYWPPGKSSYILVTEGQAEGEKLAGVLTERDIVCLTAFGTNLAGLTVADAMTPNPIVLKDTDYKNIFTAISYLRQHRIRHLPAVKATGQLLGVITHETLHRSLQPAQLLRMRTVAEVMTAEVVRASPTTTVLELARMMARHRVSCVVIVEESQKSRLCGPSWNPTSSLGSASLHPTYGEESQKPGFLGEEEKPGFSTDSLVPVGIVTERDIVQYQLLGLNLAELPASKVMSAPLYCVSPEDSLYRARQQMERLRVRRLVVRGSDGSLAGIVTQSSLLQTLSSIELYATVNVLQQQVSQLQSEKLEVLKKSNSELRELNRQLQFTQFAVDRAVVPIYWVDSEGRFLYVNEAAATSLGYSKQELLSMGVVDVARPGKFSVWVVQGAEGQKIDPNLSADGWGAIWQELKKQKSFQVEVFHQRKDGSIFPIEISGNYLEFQGREYSCCVGRDLSDRYRAERQLAQLNRELELRVQQRTSELQAEIRERLQVEVALRESEERFRTVFEQAAVGIDICDLQGRFVRVNQKLCDIFGYTTEELQNLTFVDLTHPDDRPFNTVRLRSLLAEEISTFSIEKRYLHKHGHLIWANVTVSLLRDRTGQPQYYIGVIQDIGDRKQAELALKQSEEMFRAIFEQAAVGIACCDASQKLIKVNQKFCEIVGSSQEELKQLSYVDITYPQDLEVERKLAACIEPTGPVSYSVEKRYIRKNGELVWVNLTASLLPNLKQSIFGIAVVEDINSRKLIQEELRTSEEKYKTLFEILPIGVAIADKDGYILQANPASSEVLGKSIAEEKPRNLRDLKWEIIRNDGSKMPVTEWAFLKALEENIVVKNQEAGIIKADGKIAWISITAAPIPLEGYGVAIAYVDITERKQIEQMKEEFLATASHELRTPLTSLRGSLGLLATGKLGGLSDSGKRLLEFALLDTERLVRLVKDILDLQHLKSGKKTLNFQSCQTDLLLERAAKIVEPIAEKAEVNLSVNAVSISVVADGDVLIQVLTNLLDNAIKFSQKGSTVWAIARQHPEGVLFIVRDCGRGIPADKLETIFQPFGQADASDSRDRSGTGLGLPICRTIVQQLKGRIWVESTPGAGSSFYVLLTDSL